MNGRMIIKMNKIVAGLVLTAIGLWGMISWWWFVCDVIKGLAVIIFIICGLILIGLGLKNGYFKSTKETK